LRFEIFPEKALFDRTHTILSALSIVGLFSVPQVNPTDFILASPGLSRIAEKVASLYPMFSTSNFPIVGFPLVVLNESTALGKMPKLFFANAR